MAIIDHLRDRHFDTSLHKVWCDDEEGVATFPIYTITGKMTGYQQYRPYATKEKRNHPREGRYYTYTTKTARGVWGCESWYLSNHIYITEGIFCACRLTKAGRSAIALLSNDPKYLSEWLLTVRSMRPVIAICDSGVGGRKLKKFANISHTMPSEFDLGDAPEEYFLEVLNINQKEQSE